MQKGLSHSKDAIRITGVHFSYNKTKQDEKYFFQTITKIHNVLKKWRMQILTLEGKIIVFKTLAISKIVYLSSPNWNNSWVRKNVIWWTKPKIKNETISSDFKDEGFKNLDIN